ncbi:MAG: CAP domain-containing protein, partial [Anaerolineae bacterium]
FNNTPNALMTYALPPGEANHDPGPVVRGMFGDMGWTINNATPTPSPTASLTPTFTPTPSATITPTITPTPSSYDAYMPLVMDDFSVLTPTPTPLPSDWLGYFNALRTMGGLPTVTENASWSNGCTLHARYMVKNDTFGVPEDPANPWYTAEGDAAAQNSNILLAASLTLTDTDILGLWMSAPFHGLGMLAPGLQSTGFGSYREAIGQFQTGACLDVNRGLGSVTLTFPVMWPAEGEASPLATSTIQDTPDPLSACSGYTLPTGAPIYLMLGPGWTITPTVTTSSLTDGSTALPHCVLSSATYTNPDATLQQLGRTILRAYDAVVLIPKDPLIPGTQYSVALTINGQQYAWSFTVRAAALHRSIPSEVRIR